MDPTALADQLAFAERLADASRPIIRAAFRTGSRVDWKADASPVTETDRAAEAAIRSLIAEHRPEHGIFGEEHGRSGLDRRYVWVIDPIDGTRSFMTGMPLFGTLIALAESGRPVLGVIDAPATEERWAGAVGIPSRFQGAACRTSGCSELADATLYSTTPDMFTGEAGRRYDALGSAVRQRRFGGDCYQYGLLASGHIDLVVEAGLQPYDHMALAPVIEGAGGVATTWSGAPLSLETDGTLLAAATPALHAAARAVLAG